MKKEALYAALNRFARVFIAVLLAGIVAKYGDSQWFLVLAPFINAVSKWLRDSWGWDLFIV